MPLRLDEARRAYRIAHAAGWDEGNRRMQRDRRAEWNAEDWNHAAATFRRVMGALGHPEPEAPANPQTVPHGKPAVLRRQPRYPARARPG